MLIKLLEPILFGECIGSAVGQYLTCYIFVENGRVYASNHKKQKLDLLGRTI